MALRTTPFHGAAQEALLKRRSVAPPAGKAALIASAALALLALSALVLFAASVSAQKAASLVQIGPQGDPLLFPEFQDLCLDACKRDPHKAEKCEASRLSTFYLDYQGECEKKPGMCPLARIRCGGPWRPENLT